MAYSKKNESDKQEGFWDIPVLLVLVILVRTFGFGLYQVPSGSMETTMLVGERFFADKFTVLFTDVKRGDVIAFNDPLYAYSKNKYVRLFQNKFWGPSNWTKRVVGIPGDELKGVIENGHPVIYVNGTKLHEPYVNSCPLVQTWSIDMKEVQKAAKSGMQAANLGQFLTIKSYVPTVPFEKQPYYRIDKDRLLMNKQAGEPVMILPGTPIQKGEKVSKGKNYWNNGDEFYVKLGKNQYWVMGDNRLGSFDSRIFGPIKKELIHGKILFRIWSIDSNENWWIIDLLKHPIDFFRRIRLSRFFQVVK